MNLTIWMIILIMKQKNSIDFMSDTITNGIRIKITSKYDLTRSEPERNRYIFSYNVLISNEGTEPSTLISRRWIITNSFGQVQEVKGIGVAGETPTILPGDTFEYMSYCSLNTEWGTMEGSYQIQNIDGSVFDAIIGKFLLSKNDIIKH